MAITEKVGAGDYAKDLAERVLHTAWQGAVGGWVSAQIVITDVASAKAWAAAGIAGALAALGSLVKGLVARKTGNGSAALGA